MRIVYVWDADYPWDVRTEKVCLALADAGHEVHIAARNRQWRPLRERLPEGEVHRMPPWRWAGRRLDGALSFPAFLSPRWIAHLDRVVREARPDVVIARDLPLCPTAIRAARKAGAAVVFDMAENYPERLRDIRAIGRQRGWDFLVRNPAAAEAVERWCLPRVDRVLAVVEESAGRVVRMGVPAARVAVVSNTPPAARARETPPREPRGAGEPLGLVYLGLMEVPRGLADLLRAVALLRGRGVEVRLRLIGRGRDLPVLQALAGELGLEPPWVEFAGWVPGHADALARVAAADVAVMPHHATEAWNTTISNKTFDFMAAGLPVVSSDAAPAARILRETGAGVVVPSRDPAALAAAIERLRDPALREALGRAGQRAVLSTYNWEADAAELLRVVESAAAERADAARGPLPAELEAEAAPAPAR